MNSQSEQPFQFKQLRSQSLSPYNDFNLIKQLKRQLHCSAQKTAQILSLENKANQEQIEANIISSDSIKNQCNAFKSRRNSLIFEGQSIPINPIIKYSVDVSQFYKIAPQILRSNNYQQKIINRKQKPINPINSQDFIYDDDANNQSTVDVQNPSCNPHTETKRQYISILPNIKKQKAGIEEEYPIKRLERYEQLMKQTCDEQLNELQTLIKKIQKPPVGKKEKKVTFLI
ncbi:unnamed protein product (macronuclear) [Paramecium tetraurelia]|uniref:Enkurin domain-containing protein n=1 Tax=Paramecium tetraurelia TaxID=5888 RepID=A0BL09_PARTE|nr:uncharacterized protein GSPATT00029857001 [Paramecium tetraurelia]CAK59226.1 unnamed protein product [Paramecium tetraurelia]|eukprot:XP_001426624.1 hypothetical protein (macronuclear) [Paramecium tetraurelia strain d4-2]